MQISFILTGDKIGDAANVFANEVRLLINEHGNGNKVGSG